MGDRDEYDLDGEKVLLLINVQHYDTEKDIESARVDVNDIKATFEERVT